MILADSELCKKYQGSKIDGKTFVEQYQQDYYGQELNLEKMQEEFCIRVDPQMIKAIGSIAPVMKRCYQIIEGLDNPRYNGKQQAYYEQATQLARKELILEAQVVKIDDAEMTQLIGEIANFEISLQQEGVRYEDLEKKMVNQNQIREKIQQIKKMNPILAKTYETVLQDIEKKEKGQEEQGLHLPNEEEMQLFLKIEFYLASNLPEVQENNAIAVYKPSLWKRFWNKRNNWKQGRKEENMQEPKEEEQEKQEETLRQEPEEFSNMSLEELRRTAQQLAEKIQEQERIQEQQKEDQKSMGEGE